MHSTGSKLGFDITIATKTETRDVPFRAVGLIAFLIAAGATVYWTGSMGGGMTMPGGWTLSMIWMRMPGQAWLGSAGSFMAMWLAMMIAMMLPALWPSLERYHREARDSDHARLRTLGAAAAYFLVWAGVGAVVYLLGVSLAASEMRSPGLAHLVPVAAGAAVVLAGVFQLTPWKARHLASCRAGLACGSPVNFRSASRLGVGYGVSCAFCCAGFMLVLVVTGMMNLLTVVLLAAAITIERVVTRPEWAVRAAGVTALGLGALFLVRAS